jgi:methionyl-tRNA formyltransferase
LAEKTNLTMKDFSIIFMGTPEFAVEIVKKLHQEGIIIKAVVTAPDKPAGRGQKMHQSAVKEYAVDNNLPVLQPINLKDEEFIAEMKSLNADLFVVVAFRMLPEVIWNMPRCGTINLHASLLPNYRGAAPINWALMNGETETGVTTFFIEKEIDTGKIIEQSKVTIGENEDIGSLYERLMILGADVMLSTVHKIEQGNVTAISQNDFDLSTTKPAPKIFKPDCKIDFNNSVQAVHNFCRGLSPYPAAWCQLTNTLKEETKTYKIFTTKKTEIKSSGNGLKSNEDGILIPCGDFYLSISEIQPEGKRKMNFKDFLAGNSVTELAIKD